MINRCTRRLPIVAEQLQETAVNLKTPILRHLA